MHQGTRKGTVARIFIAPAAEQPMIELESVRALAGQGLEGDRYATRTGSYSASPRKVVRHLSLIARDAIDAANRDLSAPFDARETRRNIVVEGISAEQMNALVGRTFRLGEALLRGVEKCDPCDRPSNLTRKPGFRAAFAERGGLRAEIVEGGRIARGDALEA